MSTSPRMRHPARWTSSRGWKMTRVAPGGSARTSASRRALSCAPSWPSARSRAKLTVSKRSATARSTALSNAAPERVSSGVIACGATP